MTSRIKKMLSKVNKNHLIIAGIIIVLCFLLMIVWNVSSSSKDSVKFKSEYEALNNKKSSSGKTYQKLKIPRNNKVKYSSVDEVLKILNDGTGLIYMGFSNCPWCRGMLPILLDKVDCSCIENLLYVDMTDVRDVYEVKDGNPELVKEASSNYYDLMGKLDEFLEKYTVKDEDGIEYEVGEKRIYVPLVVAVKDGQVLGVYDGIDLNEGQSPYDALTETQKSEIEAVFDGLISKITKEDSNDAVCDEHC